MAKKTLEIFRNEDYMNDATLSAFCSFTRALKKRDDYIWTVPNKRDLPGDHSDVKDRSTSLQQWEHNFGKANNLKDSVKNKSSTKTSIPKTGDKNMELVTHDIVENAKCDSKKKFGSDISVKEEKNIKVMHEQVFKQFSEAKNMNVDCVEEIIKASESTVKERNCEEKPAMKQGDPIEQFKNWCFKRQFEHLNSPLKKQHNVTTKKYPILPPEPIDNRKSVKTIKSFDPAFGAMKQNQIKLSKKRIRHSSESIVEGNTVKQKISSMKERHRENGEVAAKELMLCITIICKRSEKSYEITTYHTDLLRLKRNFPKLSNVFPIVDVEEKEIDYSADAVKAALGFLFNPSYNLDLIQNKTTALEVLAIFHSWEIDRFKSIVQKYFLQNFLTEQNAKSIYPVACHFGLKEICDAFEQFLNRAGTDFPTVNYRPKKCSIAVSTYIESLEFSIPLESVEDQLMDSFNRPIENEIIFEAISECYVITGFQIEFNGDKIKNIDPTQLKIFYSAENTTENLCVVEQKADKPLRPRIIMYFKKKLIIKPSQKGKISVSTDITPCLCFTFHEDTISKGDFNLTLTSNFKVQRSDKCFFIGKLFYHVKTNV